MFKLIKNGTLYAPEELGAKDILIHGEKIIKTDDSIKPPSGFDCETIDASGKIIYPGFVDGHVHLIGADDGQGPMGRTSDIAWKDIVESGTTTVVGCLGSSRFVRSLHSLYIKTLELDMMGLCTYMYTGSFVIPPPTLTGEIRKDIYLIPKVIGLKTAISDTTTNHHTWRDLAAITSEVLYGADIANKHAVPMFMLVSRRPGWIEYSSLSRTLASTQRGNTHSHQQAGPGCHHASHRVHQDGWNSRPQQPHEERRRNPDWSETRFSCETHAGRGSRAGEHDHEQRRKRTSTY